MIDDFFAQNYYSGISGAKVTLTEEDTLEITFANKMKSSKVTFIISNIGSTTNELVEEFVNGDSFFPEAVIDELPADPVVENMLTKNLLKD